MPEPPTCHGTDAACRRNHCGIDHPYPISAHGVAPWFEPLPHTQARAIEVTTRSRTGLAQGDFGSEGREAGQFRLPTDATFAGTTIWVADTLNSRVQMLQLK